MKFIIHDVTETVLHNILPQIEKDDIIITDTGGIRPCIGCFGCWLKTPGTCILKDSYQQMGKSIARCSEMIIISRCVYGCYSPFVKNVLDRSISYIHPYFTIKNGEMHHQQRYKKNLAMKAVFYGSGITSQEKKTAVELVAANAVNFYGTVKSVTFLESLKEAEVLKI